MLTTEPFAVWRCECGEERAIRGSRPSIGESLANEHGPHDGVADHGSHMSSPDKIVYQQNAARPESTLLPSLTVTSTVPRSPTQY